MSESKRQAVRELRWLANQFKGVLAWADEQEAPLDAAKELAQIQAEIEEAKKQRANYTDLSAEVAAKRAELASVTADIDRVRAMFKTA